MTIDDIINQIKTFGHDKLATPQDIYSYINLALIDIENRGDFNWQLYSETVTVPKGETQITLSKQPVKRIVSIDPSYINLTLKNGLLQLEKPPDNDVSLTVVYTFYHPKFDGTDTNKIIPEPCDKLYVLGGVFYMMVRNEDPSAPYYQQKFQQLIDECYQQDLWKVPYNSVIEEIGNV